MSWVAVAVGGATLIGGVMSSNAQADAASSASSAQQASDAAAIAEKRRQFDVVQGLLKPYADAGPTALGSQLDLLGVNGPEKQQAAYSMIQQSPAFASMTKTGEDAILQNASATGGLRGGNVQKSLAQFRPQLLSSLIDSQYSKLGGITGLGENAAAGTGNAALSTGSDIATLMQAGGAAQAGGILAGGQAQANMWGNVTKGIGQFAGLGGFSRF